MKALKRFGCFLIGWNPDILKECGEASQRQFRKLLSAIIIMVILWGTIGYCVADRYLGFTSIPAKLGISVAFMIIILCVERVIILMNGLSKFMVAMRLGLALCMALLGSCIFDQIFFSRDIQQAIADNREDVVQQTIQKRLTTLNSEERRLSATIQQLTLKNDSLYQAVAARPTTTVTAVSTQNVVAGHDANGKPIIKNMQSVNRSIVPNPLIKQAEQNQHLLATNDSTRNVLRQAKLNLDKTTRAEIMNRPNGFIEELLATWKVITGNTIALVFYIILFVFLLMLELFVISIRLGDKKCDYDLVVEHQLELKENQIESTQMRLSGHDA